MRPTLSHPHEPRRTSPLPSPSLSGASFPNLHEPHRHPLRAETLRPSLSHPHEPHRDHRHPIQAEAVRPSLSPNTFQHLIRIGLLLYAKLADADEEVIANTFLSTRSTRFSTLFTESQPDERLLMLASSCHTYGNPPPPSSLSYRQIIFEWF